MAVLAGIIVGAIDALFGRVLIAISDFRTLHYQYLLPFLPIAGLVITAMYYAFSKLSLKGMKLIFEVGQEKTDSVPLLLIPLVMIGTWLTHLFGGSAGREGVAVQIGATLSHTLGRKFFSCDQRYSKLIWNKDNYFCDLSWNYLWTCWKTIFILIK